MKCAIYARFSSDRQRAESIEAQVQLCRDYAKKHGLKVVATYSDAALSGTSAKHRPEYQRMLKAAEAREFDTLLCEDLSRLSRDDEETARVAKRFKFFGVRVIGVGDGYDSAAGSADVTRLVKSLHNRTASEDTARRVHRQLADVTRKGFWAGGRVFGYALMPEYASDGRVDAYGKAAKVGTLLAIDKEQAAAVKRIFNTYIAGLGHRAIAAALNGDKVPSPGSYWKGRKARRAKGWQGSGVRVILHNPIYTGTVRWNRREFRQNPDTERDSARMRPSSEWVVRQDESLRIIDQGLWEAAQARIKTTARKWGGGKNAGRRSGGKSKYVLSGLLVCDHCEAHFVLADRLRYACGSIVGGSPCGNTAKPARKLLESKMAELVEELLASPGALGEYRKEVKRYYAEASAAQAAAVKGQPAELRELDARLKRLQKRIEKGDPDLTRAELEGALARLQDERRTKAGIPTAIPLDDDVLRMLPITARALHREIRAGFDGRDPARIAEARITLGRLMPEGLRLRRDAKGRLWAHWGLSVMALSGGPVQNGRGDRI